MATEDTKKPDPKDTAAADAKQSTPAAQSTQPVDKDTKLTKEEQGAIKDIAQERVNHDAQAQESAPQNPMGTMPTQAFHPGAGASDEEVEAYRRANPSALTEDPDHSTFDPGAPIECIVKKDFYDDRGAIVKAGERYYYFEKEGQPFPYPVLEPINKSKAQAKAKEYHEAEKDAENARNTRQKRLDAFARLADESGA